MTAEPTTRSAFLAASLIVPAVLGVAALTWLERSPDPRQADPPAAFGELLRSSEVEDVFALVRTGVDVNRAIRFRDADLTGGQELFVTPLLIATAAKRENTVAMLLSFGARLGAPGNEFAVCLARRMGNDALAEMIVEDSGRTAPTGCPGVRATDGTSSPLAVFALPPP